MKFLKVLLVIILISVLASSVFAIMGPLPSYMKESIRTEEGFTLVKQFEHKNFYYAKDIIVLCFPRPMGFEGFCSNMTLDTELITSVRINGKDVDYSFVYLDDLEQYGLSYYDWNRMDKKSLSDNKPLSAIKIEKTFLNNVNYDLTINEHEFVVTYEVKPYFVVALFFTVIVLGFVSLYMKKLKTKKKMFITSIVLLTLSLLYLNFKDTDFVMFLIPTFLFFITDYMKTNMNSDYNNITLKWWYGILVVIGLIIIGFVILIVANTRYMI
ncbi:MAG: hypothetical protein ABIB43_04765 [archaeon]